MKLYLRAPLRRRIAGWTIAATATVILAACGSKYDEGAATASPAAVPPSAPSVPGSAVVDIASFINYLNTLMTSDTQEPLLADAVTPPSTDTGEPTAI